ncbi:MAG: TOMM system kinase/cyclase fusion protein [Acidobacteriota bacterium]|jgi:TOMM system kinase/cyclase fusion protein
MVGSSLGRYTLVELLGKGGMGDVYVAEDTRLRRHVAIKVVSDRGGELDSEDELLREARTAAALSHPNICKVFDVGTDDERVYMAMELIDGKPLSELIASGPLPLDRAVAYCRDVAAALAHAHARGVVHRDLKAANVMVAADGAAKVLDFGLATRSMAAEIEQAVTARVTLAESAGIAGTIPYMPPEVLRGELADVRSDIWSLGVVLYEALAGCRPFAGASGFELSAAILKDEPVPLPHEIPAGIRALVERCLAKDPEVRCQHAGEVQAALEMILPALETADAGAREAPSTSPPAGSVGGREPSTPEPSGAESGAAQQAETPSPPASTEAERRRLTLMVCECEAAATGGGAAIDPEDEAEIVAGFRELVRREGERFGGTVVSEVAHRVLLSFGYPVSDERAAESAGHAGLAILNALREANRSGDQPRLETRISINTGLVVVSAGGGVEPASVVGEGHSLVTRLGDVTDPDMVVITASTRELIEGFFAVESLGEHDIRGLAAPVELFAVHAATEARTRIDTVEPASLTPLIGRDQELALLLDRWDLARQGMGQVLLLTGEAGIGKSRLVRELRQRLIDVHEAGRAPIVEWRCSPYSQNSALRPAVEYVGRMLRFTPTDDNAARLAKLEDNLQGLGLALEATVPFVAPTLGLSIEGAYPASDLTPQRIKERTLEVLADWLCAYARRRAALFIVEDLHWIDPSTLDLLTMLTDQIHAEPMLCLLTARPEFTVPWPIRTHHTQVALTRLTRAQVIDLMAKRTGQGDLSPEVVERVIERTDGVPLFVEEFSKVLEESGVLAAGSESDVVDLMRAIPLGLQDLLLARLDRLASNKEVVQLGATVGREFSYQLIKAASPLEETSLRRELDKLVAAELLYQRARPPESSYLFKHALIQDAAYESMLHKKRQQFHALIAAALRRHFPETERTQPEVLAHHYAQSGDFERAARFGYAAAQKALEASANHEAVAHATTALEAIGHLPETPDNKQLEIKTQMALGPAVMALKGYSAPEMGRAYSRARNLCNDLGQPPELTPVLFGLWTYHVVRAEYATTEEIARQMIDMGERADDPEMILEGQCCLAMSLYYRNRLDSGRASFDTVLAMYDPARHRDHLYSYGHEPGVVSRAYYGLALWWLGEADLAVEVSRESRRLSQEAEHPYSMGFAHTFAAHLYQLRGEVDEALEMADFSIALSTEHGFPLWQAYAGFIRGWALAERGDFDDALAHFETSLASWDAMGALIWLPYYRSLQAQALGAAGDVERAIEVVDEAVRLAEETDELLDMSHLTRLRGELVWQQAEAVDNDALRAEARELFAEALAIARRDGARSWELRAAIMQARTASDSRRAAAREDLRQVYEALAEGRDSPHLKAAAELLEGEIGS